MELDRPVHEVWAKLARRRRSSGMTLVLARQLAIAVHDEICYHCWRSEVDKCGKRHAIEALGR